MYGRMQTYAPETETISAYLERLHLFFDANGTADGKKVSVLLTVIGAETYTLLRGQVSPVLPKDKTFEELETVLKAHFEPKSLVIAERFRFYRRSQTAEETTAQFVAAMRKLAASCQFGGFLNEALRDRLVCDLKDQVTQTCLLSEAKLTLDSAIELAQRMESAGAQVKKLKDPAPSAGGSVFKANVSNSGNSENSRPPTAPGPRCARCGKKHPGSVCRFVNTTCHRCGKVVHIAPVCRSGRKSSRLNVPGPSKPEGQGTDYVAAEGGDPLDDAAVLNILDILASNDS